MATMIHEVSMVKVMKSIQLKVRFERTARLRLWIATRLMIIAGWVAGCDLTIEDQAEAVEVEPQDGWRRYERGETHRVTTNP